MSTDEHDGIDGTLLRNYFRCCDKCGKTQKGNKLPGQWGTWLNIGDMDFSKYPANRPIIHNVVLYGSKKPSKQKERHDKLDQLLKETK